METKAPWSQPVLVRGPFLNSRYFAMARTRMRPLLCMSSSVIEIGPASSFRWKAVRQAGWSCSRDDMEVQLRLHLSNLGLSVSLQTAVHLDSQAALTPIKCDTALVSRVTLELKGILTARAGWPPPQKLI